MATEIVADRPASKFFSLSANYEIAEGAKLTDLAADANLLLKTGLAVFDETYEELSEAQWAGMYVLRQAAALVEELERRVEHGEVRHG